MEHDLSTHKKKLEEEAEAVTKELKTLGVVNPRAKEDWIPTPGEPIETEPDENIIADRAEEWEERRGTLDVLETRLNNINHALQKIEMGTYGVCEICGQEIESDRLAANPASRTCKEHLEDEAVLGV